jgi:hypothetical protein
MSRPLVYYDNMIVSSLTTGDLFPFAERAPVDTLEQWNAEGRILRVTSKVSPMEQARTADPSVRAALAARVSAVPQVAKDHLLLGMSHQDLGRYGWISSPLISDIVDEPLYSALAKIGIKDRDARHIMYAQHNGCDYFATTDDKDILPHRDAIESACSGLQVVRPSELVARLSNVIKAGPS